MKKKFMMVATIFGILSLGACVDDKESPSVEAVRNAKAKQLEAMAEMYKANGEADLIRANAEKALKEAEAEYQRALAALENANAEDQQRLTEEAKVLFAERIKQLELETANALLRLQLEKAIIEQQLAGVDDEYIKTLYGTYVAEASDLAGLNDNLLGEQIILKQLEGDLIDVKALVAKKTVEHNNTIARKKAYIAALEALPANNKAELATMIEEFNVELDVANTDKVVKADALNKARNTYLDQEQNLLITSSTESSVKLIEAAKSLRNNFNYSIIKRYDYYDLTESKSIERYSLVESEVILTRNWLNSDIESQTGMIGKVATGTEPATGMYAVLVSLQVVYDAAKDAYEDPVTGGTENLRQQMVMAEYYLQQHS